MRILTVAVLLAAFTLPLPAQSGRGWVQGSVFTENPARPGYPGGSAWLDSASQPAGVEVTLTPTGPVRSGAPEVLTAQRDTGDFDFGAVPMGAYRLHIAVPGYQPWDAELYVPSDGRTRLFILLRRGRPDDGGTTAGGH